MKITPQSPPLKLEVNPSRTRQTPDTSFGSALATSSAARQGDTYEKLAPGGELTTLLARPPSDGPSSPADSVRSRVGLLRTVAHELQVLAREPLPLGLPTAALATATQLNAWIESTSVQLADLADHGETALLGASPSGESSPAEPTFDEQYLQLEQRLQQELQQESRRFSSLAGVMRAKLDAAMRSIDNVR
jgi:hypothetical protein